MSFFTSPDALALLARQRQYARVTGPLRGVHRDARALSRRTLALFQAADLFCPELVRDDLRYAFSALASVEWLRPLMTWTGGDWRGLVAHLLVRDPYPLPPFLFAPPRNGYHHHFYGARYRSGVEEREASRLMRLIRHLGAGGGLRAARRLGILPRCMTRRMDHLLLNLDGAPPLGEAVRRVQVQALGGPPWLAEALCAARLGRLQERRYADWWQRVIAWMCADVDALPRQRVVTLVDWLRSPGVLGEEAPLRRRLANAVSEAVRWHVEPHRRDAAIWRCPPGPLPPSGITPWRHPVGEVVWTIEPLTSGAALQAEGQALQHCVASYYRLVRGRSHAILSLRAAGQRRLTVEVRLGEKSIVQARGARNRAPLREERALLERWAAERGLRVRAV